MSLLDNYLSRDELAKELRVTTRTIARWQAKPNGIPVTQIGGRTLFRVESVKTWLAAHEIHPNPRRAVAG